MTSTLIKKIQTLRAMAKTPEEQMELFTRLDLTDLRAIGNMLRIADASYLDRDELIGLITESYENR